MELPDGTILMHGKVPYDPVRAHQYYIRTRELKGRRKGQAPVAKGLNRYSVTKSPTFSVVNNSGRTVRLTGQQLAEQRAYITKRIGTIKKNLAELGVKLRKAKAEAEQKKAKAAKPATAAEKSKAARESKQYQDKHKQQLATKRKIAAAKTGSAKNSKKADPVAELETKITKIKGRLTAAVAHQRALAAATKNS